MKNYSVQVIDYFRQRNRGWVFALLAAVLIVYLPFLGNPFFFDDLPFFYGNNASEFAGSPLQLHLRWLPYASLGWTWAFFIDAPHFFHLGNALLHAANVILLFYLLRLLSRATIPALNESIPAWGAWLGALIFACHPVAVYAVGYVVQRSILMATLFSLVMLLSYVQGLLSGKKRCLLPVVVAYLMACFSKEHSVMMPAVLVAVTILLHSRNKLDRMSLSVTWVALAAVGLLTILRTRGVFGLPYEPMAAVMFEQQGMVESSPYLHLLSVLAQAGLFFKYLLLWIVPNPAWMSVDMREPFIASWTAWRGLAGALGFIVYGVVACRLLLRKQRMGLIGLALLYPWLLFIVELSSIRIQEPFVLYRSYLWMPGLMLFFPVVLSMFPLRRTKFVVGLLVLLLTAFSWNRLWVFGDNYRLWNDAALLLQNEHVAGADRIYYNRGIAEIAAKNWDKSIEDLQRVKQISPGLAPARYALGMAFYNAGRYQEAIGEFDVMISLKPDAGQAYYGKGLSLKRLHKDEQAIQQMQIGCELKNMMACMIAARASKK